MPMSFEDSIVSEMHTKFSALAATPLDESTFPVVFDVTAEAWGFVLNAMEDGLLTTQQVLSIEPAYLGAMQHLSFKHPAIS